MSTKEEEMINWGFGSLILWVYDFGSPLFLSLAPPNRADEGHLCTLVFTFRLWRRGKNMLETRSFFTTDELGGQIIIAGGHNGSKNVLRLAWVYHVRRDEWVELASMSQERDEC
jgi:hypothetical protein